jgi:hypothetical protein
LRTIKELSGPGMSRLRYVRSAGVRQSANGPVYTIPRPFPINISLNSILFSGFCILKSSVESQYGMVTEDFFVLNASSNLKYSIT